ncbi:class I SAM-dependent methyltransferase [Methanobacterium sp. A39]|uniref:class I SAM-dependent methyltransferase n=1 Tax=Methanobacterium sp. A39 TaxID=1860100 RepID=UPI00084C4396|nr:class I SAM-dependent methyltransferase [Methanobacterium sp. A39]OEC88529.1 hypothetical protein A9507_04585 [Methanobacterium sp. A39]
MNKFWNNVILPIIESINASYIVEVGSDTGINTRNILEYCVEHDAHMTAIDPSPNFNFEEFELKYEDKFEIYRELSISRLPLLENYDVILLDGDHNWYTVYNELKIIEKNFKNKKFPLVILHDIGWPYARRDLYYNPENIPEAYRQPYKKLGMYPGQTDLKNQGGLNRHLYNSIYENNPKNGTLTAVEDFIDESDLKFSFKLIKAFHGLGILFIKNDEMETIIKEIIEKADLLNNLEEERVKLLIAHSESNLQGNSLKKELNENKKKLEYVENRLNLTELKSANETKLIQKKEEQLKNIKDQLNQTKTRLDQTEGRFEQIKDHLNLSNELIQKKEEQLRNAKDQLNQTINNLKQTEIKLKSSNDLAKETKKQLEKTEIQLKLSLELIQEKEAFIDEIENELKQTKNQLESSNKLVQEKQSIIDNIKKKKKKTVKELNSQIDDLKVSLIEMEYLSNKDRPLIQRLISRFPSLYILFNMNETGFKHALINIKGHNTIKNDNLFDIGFYLKNNKSVRLSGMDPILHYLYHGFKEGKKPSPTFNSDYYLKRYKDVKNSNLNPLIHYGLYGKNEGRKTTIIKNQNKAKKNKRIQLKSDYNVIYDSGLFDADWYLKKNPDVVSANMDPLVHFIRHGANENRDPNPNFSISVYLQKNSDIVSSGMNPLVHYIKYGIKEEIFYHMLKSSGQG